MCNMKWEAFTYDLKQLAAYPIWYADYEPLAYSSDAAAEPQTFAGFYEGATSHRLMVCESTSDNYNILGNIDAIRFWRGNPDPSQFLSRVKGGFVLIVR